MNKYQRVINQIAKLSMKNYKIKQLLENCEIKNTFSKNRSLVKLFTKDHSYKELLETKNKYRRN